jgi:hypothetical protein
MSSPAIQIPEEVRMTVIYAKLLGCRTGEVWKKSGLTPFSFIDVLTPRDYEQRGRHPVLWLWLAPAVLAIAVLRVMQ